MHRSRFYRFLMTVITGLTALLSFLPSARSIICYRCTVHPAMYLGEKNQLCSKFDGGPDFYEDCPKSTFCRKRIIHYRLFNGSMVSAYERDCAPQKYVYQDYHYDDRRWHSEEKVDIHAYTAGCFKSENRGAPNGPSEYCYCSSNYCNTSGPTINHRETFIFLVITVILRCALF